MKMERTKFLGRMYDAVNNSKAPISWMVPKIIHISQYKKILMQNTRYQYTVSPGFILSG